jgi:hypothetical protein
MISLLRGLMSSDGGTNRPLPSLILLGIVDFVCILMAAESYRDGRFFAAIVWLVVGIASAIIGYYWGIRKSHTALPERPPHVLPTDYGKDDKRHSFGLFLRNPGYDATTVHIPSVSIGQSAYKLTFPETLSVLCERDYIVFMEALLEDQTLALPGLDGSRLHDVMRLADVDLIEFPILYGGLDFPDYYTNCIIERVNWKRDGLTVREAGHGKGKPAP